MFISCKGLVVRMLPPLSVSSAWCGGPHVTTLALRRLQRLQRAPVPCGDQLFTDVRNWMRCSLLPSRRCNIQLWSGSAEQKRPTHRLPCGDQLFTSSPAVEGALGLPFSSLNCPLSFFVAGA
ncbi:hypothetical protein B0O80DRAFT_170757 [Mortierella sp. GBAus27b]|nr:hypothetical protein B0O80DRAFT_170757 [Mortierella sp. GBAus27b]